MAGDTMLFRVFFLLSTQQIISSQLPEFSFYGFKNSLNDLTLNGFAEVEFNGALKLTNTTQREIGHAFYSNPIKFKTQNGKSLSFSTAFAFVIVPQSPKPKLGGHGLAFTISPSKHFDGAFPSQFLGLMNARNMGNYSNHILAVEFDSVRDFEFGDIDDNHIGIDINSLKSNASVPAAYFLENSTKRELILEGGQAIQAWIDYDAGKERLEVRISPNSEKPRLPILTFDVDLSTILKEEMYLGFSAATGLLASSHYILGWSFNMNGEAKSLTLSSLPSVPTPEKKKKTKLILVASLSASASVIILIVALGFFIRRFRNEDRIEDWELEVGPHRYSYQELKKATRGFRDRELIGFGGFGKVYKGSSPNSETQVAVKRISHESKQGVREFMSEISSIGRMRHRNLVQLLGWGRRRGDLLLVYDFMPNGSLDKHLFDNPRTVLSWDQRFKIIKGIASGLLYLHEGWEQTVIHRDIKSANVLLDSDMNGRLSDFGLAKLYEHDSAPATTRVVGTLGYLAPELTRHGKPSKSTDVYAFGAVMLEVVCGRRPIEPKALPEELILVDWVWETWKRGAVLEVVDKRLKGKFDEAEAVVLVKLGLLCSNDSAEVRPTMRQVVRYLEGEMELPEVIPALDFCESKSIASHCEDFVHSFPASASAFEAEAEACSACSACSASALSVTGGDNGR